MDDREVLSSIDAVVAEEHELRSRHGSGVPLSEREVKRLRSLEEHLDQLWDLLRQRRARIDAGLDPDGAAQRPPRTVEGYLS